MYLTPSEHITIADIVGCIANFWSEGNPLHAFSQQPYIHHLQQCVVSLVGAWKPAAYTLHF